MKINLNSTSTKLYLWFYATTEDKLPQNLCPYFWKLVFMYIVIIPYAVLSIPAVLLEKHNGDNFDTGFRLFLTAAISFVLFVLLTILSFPYAMLFGTPEKDSFLMACVSIGRVLWFVGILFGIYYLLIYIYESIVNRSTTNDVTQIKGDNIIVEFAKAKYHKFCPRIEWFKKQ